MDTPAPTGEVTTHSAAESFSKVLVYSGASLYRDEIDARYMEEAKTGTAKYKGSITNSPGIIDKVADVNGYTEANFGTASRPADFDTDKDGIPDSWETANGLDQTTPQMPSPTRSTARSTTLTLRFTPIRWLRTS